MNATTGQFATWFATSLAAIVLVVALLQLAPTDVQAESAATSPRADASTQVTPGLAPTLPAKSVNEDDLDRSSENAPATLNTVVGDDMKTVCANKNADSGNARAVQAEANCRGAAPADPRAYERSVATFWQDWHAESGRLSTK